MCSSCSAHFRINKDKWPVSCVGVQQKRTLSVAVKARTVFTLTALSMLGVSANEEHLTIRLCSMAAQHVHSCREGSCSVHTVPVHDFLWQACVVAHHDFSAQCQHVGVRQQALLHGCITERWSVSKLL